MSSLVNKVGAALLPVSPASQSLSGTVASGVLHAHDFLTLTLSERVSLRQAKNGDDFGFSFGGHAESGGVETEGSFGRERWCGAVVNLQSTRNSMEHVTNCCSSATIVSVSSHS